MQAPPEIILPGRLAALIRSCETYCIAGCCGIDAFDFSPLQIAAYIADGSAQLEPRIIEEWESELEKAAGLVEGLLPDDEGYICSIAMMCHYFRQAEFASFLGELRHSIHAAPKIVALSTELSFPKPGGQTFTP